jgi:hypothetical protein
MEPNGEIRETEVRPPKADHAAQGVDDHGAGSALGLGHQPVDGLDHGVDVEHLSSSSQGVRPEEQPDGGPAGDTVASQSRTGSAGERGA